MPKKTSSSPKRSFAHSLKHINEKRDRWGGDVLLLPHKHPTVEVIPINTHSVVFLKTSLPRTAPSHSSRILECFMGVPTHVRTLCRHSSSYLRL